MEHQNLEKMSSTALMLPKDDDEENVVVITPNGRSMGKILIREDTILTNLQGCTACGRKQFSCGGVKKQWSSLCWGTKSDKKYYCLLTLLTMTFVLSVVSTACFCFTNTVNDVILSNMVLTNNSLAFKMWKRPTVNPVMKVHLFNYTNWEDYRDGIDKKLRVEDVGPFVYSQQVERVNIGFDKDRLTFQEHNTFRFLPEKSKGLEFDQITVPNLPLLGTVAKLLSENKNSISLYPLSVTLNGILNFANHREAFLKLPAHRFLWGYEDSIMTGAKTILSLQGKLMSYKDFGLLAAKNGTDLDLLTINTGEKDMDKMNIIEQFNGEKKLDFWHTSDCNRIDSSDGSMFPPSLLQRKGELQVFFPKLCRRLPFRYEKEVETEDGVLLYRYRMPQNVFDSPETNSYNQCYCEIDSALCPPKGVINITACNMGLPLLASFPHFYLGDPELRNNIEGLKPDPEKHDTFLDIHPSLGISLQGKSSLQLNIQVKKHDLFPAVRYLEQDLILPIAWLQMAVEDLPDNVKSFVYHGTYSKAAVQLGLSVTSILTLLLSGLGLAVIIYKRRQKPCATLRVETICKSDLANKDS